jgi:hypothetical protein
MSDLSDLAADAADGVDPFPDIGARLNLPVVPLHGSRSVPLGSLLDWRAEIYNASLAELTHGAFRAAYHTAEIAADVASEAADAALKAADAAAKAATQAAIVAKFRTRGAALSLQFAKQRQRLALSRYADLVKTVISETASVDESEDPSAAESEAPSKRFKGKGRARIESPDEDAVDEALRLEVGPMDES